MEIGTKRLINYSRGIRNTCDVCNALCLWRFLRAVWYCLHRDKALMIREEMVKNVELRDPAKGLGKECETVLRTVPDWFGREDALLTYVGQIDELDTYTAWFKGQLIGFFSVNCHNEHSAELHVLAVSMDYHRQGVGSALYSAVESDLKAKAIKFVQVKTLGVSMNDLNYEKTRQFYMALGFLPA